MYIYISVQAIGQSRSTIKRSVLLMYPKVDYFPTTAHYMVFYCTQTTVVCLKLLNKIIKTAHCIFVSNYSYI